MTITTTPNARPADHVTESTRPSTEPNGQTVSASRDIAQVSNAALAAAKATTDEATETRAITEREAHAGDRQAQRLVSKYEAARSH